MSDVAEKLRQLLEIVRAMSPEEVRAVFDRVAVDKDDEKALAGLERYLVAQCEPEKPRTIKSKVEW